MKNQEKGIVRPRPLPKFNRPLVLHLPFLPANCELLTEIQSKAVATKSIEGCSLYLLSHGVLIHGAIGAPLAVMAYERLIASGSQEIILLGLAGSLSPDLKIGQAILVEKAIADEGTSRHYFPGKLAFHSSPDLNDRIKRKLTENGLAFSPATAVTTDAPYRETKAWLLRFRKKGAQAVDMETSALFAVASFYRIKASALLIISDELYSGHWRSGFSSSLLARKCRDYFSPFIFTT
jgi:purine-nucleoside phosphorylase